MRRFVVLGVGVAVVGLLSADPAWAQKKKIDELLKDLDSKTAQTRISALTDIGDLAAVKLSHAQKALPQVRDILSKDPEPKVRSAALVCLGKTEAEPKEYVPNMLKYVKEDKDFTVQAKALELLANYQQEAAPAIKPLQERLGELREANKDKDPGDIRIAILNTLVQINQNLGTPSSVEALEEDKAVSVKLSAVNRLAQIGLNGGAKDAPPVLIKTYEESLKAGPSPELRRAIFGALAAIRSNPKDYQAIATETLKKDKDAGALQAAIVALGRGGAAAKDTIPLVLAAQKTVMGATPKDGSDPNGQRRAMFEALGKLGMDAKQLVPVLVDGLKREKDLGVQAGVLTGLGALGEEAKPALAALKDVHKNHAAVGAKDANDPGEVRRILVETLAKTKADPKEMVPLLIASAGDKNTAVKLAAVRALGDVGPPAKAALTVLATLQKLPKMPTDAEKELAKLAGEVAEKIKGK